MRIMFLLFIIMPILEMVVLIKVGSFIGVFYTIALVLLTAMIGVTLLRQQGLKTLFNANQKMQSGQMPVNEIAEGLMLAVAGALLLTPGFVTDTVGFLLLTPGVRQILIKSVSNRLVQGIGQVSQNSYQASYHRTYQSQDQPIHKTTFEQRAGAGAERGERRAEGEVIEGEFDEEDKPDQPK